MSGELTYQVYNGPRRPFAKGDLVTVTDRSGMKLGKVKVVGVRGKVVKTDCGRTWTTQGWYRGERNAWPFPTIRR